MASYKDPRAGTPAPETDETADAAQKPRAEPTDKAEADAPRKAPRGPEITDWASI